MATWTDKDTFKLLRDTRDCYFHVLRPGVLNDLRQYSSAGDVLPIKTTGEVITSWWSKDTISAQPVTRSTLADMIRRTRPKEDLPVLVVTIPEIERADIGLLTYCWMHLNAATTMQLYHVDGTTKSVAAYTVPAADKDPVKGFSENCVMRAIGTPRIYYDWREALTPIANYFKAVIKYCKDTGKARRLAAEEADRALNDRTGTIRTLVSKNDKRFKGIEF